MGRRSINTTKSGKFMNPTDQARKEARKKELKKNKKQRLLVRTAVLKNKDPKAIIHELDKLDEVEYNPLEPPSLAEKVLKDKRRKLKETLDRVMKLYQKEEPTYWNDLRQVEMEYERRRFHRIQYFEAVKQSETMSVEDIPLPPSMDGEKLDEPPPPPPLGILKHTISSEPVFLAQQYYDGREAPGCPPGIPPDFSFSDDEDDEPTVTGKTGRKSVRFEQMDEMDKFMKELDEMKSGDEDLQPPGTDGALPITTTVSAVSATVHGSDVSAPPPPPITQMQSQPPRPFFPPVPPLMQQRMRFMLPPPPHMMAPPPPQPNRIRFNTRYRPPQGKPSSTSKSGDNSKIISEAMIQAKPQIRSLSADVTRFVPVSVKMKKDEPSTSTPKQWPPTQMAPQVNPRKSTKDDAYSEFMKEMQGLL